MRELGLRQAAAKAQAESIDEVKHADELIKPILSSTGSPNVQPSNKVNVGENVREQFEFDLVFKKLAIARLRDGIATSRGEKDEGRMLEHILVGEEEQADWLETQLELIGQVGDRNYLAQQLYASLSIAAITATTAPRASVPRVQRSRRLHDGKGSR